MPVAPRGISGLFQNAALPPVSIPEIL